MTKLTKKRKEALEKIEPGKKYTLVEAANLLKEMSYASFDESVDIDIRLGVDPRKANQMVRGTVTLPHGTGKEIKVLALVPPDKAQEAKDAGADYVGLDEYIEQIQNGWTDVDVIITVPQVMPQIGKLGRVLGPRGLMPNPKSGTVSNEPGKAIEDVKRGKIDFKVDKYGNIHTSVGKISFDPQKIKENAQEFVNTIIKMKPAAAKGTYIKSIHMATTMSPGVTIDSKSVNE